MKDANASNLARPFCHLLSSSFLALIQIGNRMERRKQKDTLPSSPIETLHHPPRPSQHFQTKVLLLLPCLLASISTSTSQPEIPRQELTITAPRKVLCRRSLMPAVLPLFHLRNQAEQARTALVAICWPVNFSADDLLDHAAPLGWRKG